MLEIERKLQEFRTFLSVKRQEIAKIDSYYVVGTVGLAVPLATILGIAVDVDARGEKTKTIFLGDR